MQSSGAPKRECPVCKVIMEDEGTYYLEHLQKHWFEIELQSRTELEKDK